MNDQRDPVTQLLSQLERPLPPPALRAGTLARAEQAWTRPEALDRWRRVWSDRPLRLAWATTVVALVAAHLSISPRSGRGPAPTAAPEVAAEAARDRELQEVVRLPRLRAAYAAFEVAHAREIPALTPGTARTAEAEEEKRT